MNKLKNIFRKINNNSYFNGFNSVPLVETIIIIIAIAVYFVLKLLSNKWLYTACIWIESNTIIFLI